MMSVDVVWLSVAQLVFRRWPAVALALARAAALSDGAELWTGRVRLVWARGLAGAEETEEALVEARLAADLLDAALGGDAALTRKALTLLRELEAR